MGWLDASGYLVDLDGTLITGQIALPWAGALLRGLQDRFVIVSNDAEHTPEQLSRFLCGRGSRCRRSESSWLERQPSKWWLANDLAPASCSSAAAPSRLTRGASDWC